MPKIDIHTEVYEIIQCEDIPGFISKKIDLGGKNIQTPIKSIYISTELPSNVRKQMKKIKEKTTIFELNRVIYRKDVYNSLNKALMERDDEDIKRVLRVNNSFDDLFMPFSFSRFPNKVLDKAFDELLCWIHCYSFAAFVPNVRYDGKGTKKTCTNYEAKTFCKYVDYVVNELNERNSKPIFVPLDIDYNANLRDKILQHYFDMGYTNIWIDFKGKVISKSILSRVRGIVKSIGKIFENKSENVVIHFSNIRKIPTEAKDNTKVRPSDVLGVFIYGDIIGVPWKGIPKGGNDIENDDVWIKKGFPSREDYLTFLFKRDSSIFDSSSYYYVSPDTTSLKDNTLNNIMQNITKLLSELSNNNYNEYYSKKSLAEKISYVVSGAIAQQEFNTMKKKVEEDNKLGDLITNYEFFKKDPEGKVFLDKLFVKKFRKNDNQMTLDLF